MQLIAAIKEYVLDECEILVRHLEMNFNFFLVGRWWIHDINVQFDKKRGW